MNVIEIYKKRKMSLLPVHTATIECAIGIIESKVRFVGKGDVFPSTPLAGDIFFLNGVPYMHTNGNSWELIEYINRDVSIVDTFNSLTGNSLQRIAIPSKENIRVRLANRFPSASVFPERFAYGHY